MAESSFPCSSNSHSKIQVPNIGFITYRQERKTTLLQKTLYIEKILSNSPTCQLTDFRALRIKMTDQYWFQISEWKIQYIYIYIYLFPVQNSPQSCNNFNTFHSWSSSIILPEVCSTAMCTIMKPNQWAVYSASTKAILLHSVPSNVPQCFHHQVKGSMPNGLYSPTAQEPYSNICSSHAWFWSHA